MFNIFALLINKFEPKWATPSMLTGTDVGTVKRKCWHTQILSESSACNKDLPDMLHAHP